MTSLPLALALAGLAAAAEPMPTTIAGLKESFVSSIERAQKNRALSALAKTAPRDAAEVQALYDLFMRFPEPAARRAAMDSLALAPNHPSLEPLAVVALRGPDPESLFFGAHVAAHARTPAALAALKKIAEQKLAHARADDASLATERGLWWAQYEALEVLAQWEGEDAYPLILKRAHESPAVGAILGRRYWTRVLPDLLKWAAGKGAGAERARNAARQPIEPADALSTRATMFAAVPDPKLDAEVRHQLALKVGASSDDAQAEELAKRHDAAKTDGERLIWASALFVSRRPAAVPVLVRYAKTDPDEFRRKGALAQLTDMLGAEKAAALVEDKKDVIK